MATTVGVSTNNNMMFLLNHQTTSEAVSNGVWSSILQNFFPAPKFVIAPEQNNGAGGRPDLTVYYVSNNVPNTHWEPVFTLEGKRPGANLREADIDQAGNYLAPLSHSNQLNGRRFGMLVAGRQVVLMVNNGGVVNQTIQWTRGDANINRFVAPRNFNIWTIQNEANFVDGFLADFASKFP